MSQFTQKAIIETFIQLLNKMPLDKIRVKDIVETCGISRNTFYYHYQDIYALLEEIFKIEVEKTLADEKIYDSWKDAFLDGISFARSNKKAIYHIYYSISREQLEQYLNRVTEYLMRKFITNEADGLIVSESDIDIIVEFYQFALVGLILEWISNGMNSDADEFITRLDSIMNGNIRLTLERAAEI